MSYFILVQAFLKIVFDYVVDKFAIFIQIKHNLCDPSTPQRTFSSKDSHIFCGYYEINPFNHNETNFLAIDVHAPLRTPKPGTVANIGYYELLEKNLNFLRLVRPTRGIGNRVAGYNGIRLIKIVIFSTMFY